MTQLTPTSSRKRDSPAEQAKPNDYSTHNTKRQRTMTPSMAASTSLALSVSGNNAPPTPPVSAKGPVTMALKLVIPQEQISREQQKKINRHKCDAERWKPKLQRPYPKQSEIRQAYPLKLMRHYPSAAAEIEPNFVRPKIDKSPRVSRLLQQFPLIDTAQHTAQPVRSKAGRRFQSRITPLDQAIALSARAEEMLEARGAHIELQANIHITGSESAQRLAWQSFSRTERDRIDRGREAMLQSGLPLDDLRREAVGLWNRLPEWKKSRTGRFAREHGAAS
ncbi:hypothetical protein EJ07DRAFT_171239 [Lizonia empirigonia]|nr:hypothetical protein EJ07DRAFT_171239 [Lizonia empirigonia]